MALLVKTRVRRDLPLTAVVMAALLSMVAVATPSLEVQSSTYTMYSSQGRRALVVRTSGKIEMIAIEQLAGSFGLSITEDRAANGIVIATRGERIFAFPGQSFVRAAGRVVALDGPVQRDRSTWLVPIDFLSKALGPAIGDTIVVRRGSRLVLVGNVKVPEIDTRIERTANGARVVIDVNPGTSSRVSRDGSKLTIRFDAAALDAGPISGFIPEYASAAHIDGTSVIVDLGPSAVVHRVDDDRGGHTVVIDLMATAPAPRPRPVAPGDQGASPVASEPGGLRTIVIDAGHGGDDAGATSAAGSTEKDVTLAMARRLKTAVETRLGLRVLLSRDGDDTVPIDRRTELANNNKADLFLSLHANWSPQPVARGAQVYTVGLDGYQAQAAQVDAARRSIPTAGGGTRSIDPVPWDLAQLPFADESAAAGAVLARHFAQRNVPLFARLAPQAPMRQLMGANMPAVLVELGFLSNTEDEQMFANAEWQAAVVESIIAMLEELRQNRSGGGGRPDRQ